MKKVIYVIENGKHLGIKYVLLFAGYFQSKEIESVYALSKEKEDLAVIPNTLWRSYIKGTQIMNLYGL